MSGNIVSRDIIKIDSRRTDGLLGVNNSLAYRVEEIEKHLHSAGSWFELAGTPTATHIGVRIGDADGAGAYRIDAGNSSVTPTWGSWVQIFGSDDTPARTGGVKFDPHEIVIEASERTETYFIQFTRGATGGAGFAAGKYTELVLDLSNKQGGTIVNVHTGRSPAGVNLWSRCLCPGQNTAWIDFYIGIHEYVG